MIEAVVSSKNGKTPVVARERVGDDMYAAII